MSATANPSLSWGENTGAVPPFAGGLTGRTNDGNDTENDEEEQSVNTETKDRRETEDGLEFGRTVNGVGGWSTAHGPGCWGAW